jgi:ABC-type lipoprotein release transport system permease subunit
MIHSLMLACRLAWMDMLNRWKLTLVILSILAATINAYLIVIDLKRILGTEYFRLTPDVLTVSQSNGFGEIYGSRLSPEVGELLKTRGVSWQIPEINDVVGSSAENALILRGVHLPDYQKVEIFDMVTGRPLQSGASKRTTMIGYRLAEKHKTAVGDKISIRGRDFTVIGIFRVGTYADNSAWISLQDAQALLNYGSDVSAYVIPDEGVIAPGEQIADGIAAGRRGKSSMVIGQEISSIPLYMGLVANVLGVLAALTLGNILWRLAWLRRRQFGVLRGMGFNLRFLFTYLGFQACAISAASFLLALLTAWAISRLIVDHLTIFGMTVFLTYNNQTILQALLWTGVILSLSVLFPLFGINRLSTVRLLSRDESFGRD